MSNPYKPKKVYTALDLLLLCLLVWVVIIIGVAFFDDAIVGVVRTLMGG